MHAAPAVRVELGRSRAWVVGVAVLCAAAAGQLIAWALLAAGWAPVALPALAAMVAAALAGAHGARRAQAPGVLAWDGTEWRWGDRTGTVALMLDLDGWLMLRFRPAGEGAVSWIAASRSAARGPWAALRAALYSPRPADPPPDVPPA